MLKNIKSVVPIVFVLAALIAVSAFSVAAIASDSTGSCGNGVNWSYENGTLTIEDIKMIFYRMEIHKDAALQYDYDNRKN